MRILSLFLSLFALFARRARAGTPALCASGNRPCAAGQLRINRFTLCCVALLHSSLPCMSCRFNSVLYVCLVHTQYNPRFLNKAHHVASIKQRTTVNQKGYENPSGGAKRWKADVRIKPWEAQLGSK